MNIAKQKHNFGCKHSSEQGLGGGGGGHEGDGLLNPCCAQRVMQ